MAALVCKESDQMKNQEAENKYQKTNNVLILIEWFGLLWCVVGLVVVFVSHYAIVSGKADIVWFEPVNFRDQWIVSLWLIPGFLLLGGARLSRRYIRNGPHNSDSRLSDFHPH